MTRQAQIIDALSSTPMAAGAIAEVIGDGATSSNVSAHLSNMLKRGLVAKSITGGWILPEGDERPVVRHVKVPSTTPSPAALASANPFNGAAIAAATEAPPSPRPPKRQAPPAEALPIVVETPAPGPRFGFFSDGTFVIDAGATRLELARADVFGLIAFLRSIDALQLEGAAP